MACVGSRRGGKVKKKKLKDMNPEGFEPPTFGSGIRRAAVAPWVRAAQDSDATLNCYP